ncbi:hypothetical protein HY442_02390 [Candidatus Parcubacteria bacterium]|nr:hypothetical protein [Candidatus Parcubacteria bacterium]MBI4099350.1 hypothetical protein [Candidatus Parcubacteria bacterium]
MAIDISTIQRAAAAPAPGRITAPARPVALIVGIVLVLLLAVLTGTLMFLRSRTQGEAEQVASSMKALDEARAPADEANILAFDTQLKTLALLLDGHIRPIKLFDFFETTTLPETVLKNFSWSSDGRLTLAGEVSHYSALGKQLLVYAQDARVLNAELTGFTLESAGVVSFSMALTLKPDVVRAVNP